MTYQIISIHHKLEQLQATSGNDAVAWVSMSVEFKHKKTGESGKFTARSAESAQRVGDKWLFSASQQLF
jgi:hypothetical protein